MPPISEGLYFASLKGPVVRCCLVHFSLFYFIHSLAHSLEEVRAEFAEFQESSGELEGELEAQLDQVSYNPPLLLFSPIPSFTNRSKLSLPFSPLHLCEHTHTHR